MLSFPLAPDVAARCLARAVLEVRAAEFEEEKHPRDEHGRWSDGTSVSAAITQKFPRAGKEVSGLKVTDTIPNTSSIGSSLTDYETLPGIREVSMAHMDPDYTPKPYSVSESNRLDRLQAEIESNKEIAPLIVVVDKEQHPYILEGGHRYDALRRMGVKSFPAKVVVDTSEVDLKSLAAKETPLHALADSHLKSFLTVVRYAFAKGRKAVKDVPRKLAADVGATAVHDALLDVMSGTIGKLIAQAGAQTVDGLPRKRAAGDVEGHEFHGNQWTAYHGTTAENAEKILKEGLKPDRNGHIWTTTNLLEAKTYARNAGDNSVVLKIDVPAHDKTKYDVRKSTQTLRVYTEPLKASYVSKHSAHVSGGPFGEWKALELRAAANLTMKFDASDPNAVDWAAKHAADLATQISDTTRDDIRQAIVDALENGDDPEEAIFEAVGDDARAELIARTEIMSAANEGQRQGWDQAVEKGLLDEDSQRVWIATDDACPECQALDGETTGLDEEYDGDGGDGPPLHPNCRCTEGITNA